MFALEIGLKGVSCWVRSTVWVESTCTGQSSLNEFAQHAIPWQRHRRAGHAETEKEEKKEN